MNMVFKNIFIAFLIFLTAGALLFCTFTPILSMNSGGHDMPSSQDGFASHFLFAQELTRATIDMRILLLSIVLLLSFIISLFLYKFYLSLELKPLEYLRRKHRDNSYVVQSTISRWLSLFESSPNLIKPA